jgi:hypothetical protein
MSEAAMTSFTWKRPRDLETEQGRETPQDLETRYEGADVDPASLAAWRLLNEQLLSSADPAIAFIGFLQTIQALPGRTLSHPRVFVSHRMVDVAYAERIAWLASQKAGLEYWLDVHDPVLRLAGRALPAGHVVYAITIAAIIEMALLNCTHVIAAHAPAPTNTSWRPSQWIPYELARAKARSVISRQTAGWFHSQVHPPQSRGEYVLLADLCGSDADVEQWLLSHAHRPIVAKPYHGTGTPNSLP